MSEAKVCGARTANSLDDLPEEMFGRILLFTNTSLIWKVLKRVNKDIAKKMEFRKTVHSWGLVNAQFEFPSYCTHGSIKFVRNNKRHIRAVLLDFEDVTNHKKLLETLFHDSEIVSIEIVRWSYELFYYFKSSKKLKHLNIREFNVCERILEFADFIKDCKFLKSFKINIILHWPKVSTYCINQAIKNFTRLKEIELVGGFKLSGQDIVQIFDSNRKISKCLLNLDCNSRFRIVHEDNGVEFTGPVTNLTTLIVRSDIITALGLVRTSKHLKNIELSACHISHWKLLEILYIPRCLKRLCMRGIPFDIDIVDVIGKFLASQNKLTVLILEDCYITNLGAITIASALVSNNVLTELNLSHNPIGSRGGFAVARLLLQNTSLTQVEVASCAIGPTGISAFAETISKNKTLRILDLSLNVSDNIGAIKEVALALNSNTTLELFKFHLREDEAKKYTTLELFKFHLREDEAKKYTTDDIVRIAREVRSNKIFDAIGIEFFPNPDIDAQFYY